MNLRFRLARIDTPERGQPGFREATDRVTELIPIGSEVIIKSDKAGGFGRWLAEVTFSDQNLSDILLNEGLAKLYQK